VASYGVLPSGAFTPWHVPSPTASSSSSCRYVAGEGADPGPARSGRRSEQAVGGGDSRPPVRGFPHGFLVLRNIQGAQLAQGDLIQVAGGGKAESHMILRFERDRGPLRAPTPAGSVAEDLRCIAGAVASRPARLARDGRGAGVREVRGTALHARAGLADPVDRPPLARVATRGSPFSERCPGSVEVGRAGPTSSPPPALVRFRSSPQRRRPPCACGSNPRRAARGWGPASASPPGCPSRRS
jgi:hypothetical protein